MISNNETIIIKKIQKRGKYYYLYCSNGNEFKLEPEIYFKYNLVEDSVFDKDKFLAIIAENSFKFCMNTVVKLLLQRMHSLYEIKMKLRKRNFPYKIISKVIDESKKMNLLDDEEFAKNYINELIYRGCGKYKIID